MSFNSTELILPLKTICQKTNKIQQNKHTMSQTLEKEFFPLHLPDLDIQVSI